ncbi:MAG: hypothetical protein RLN70_03515, partial [Rhodospirillaceae bacterium]
MNGSTKPGNESPPSRILASLTASPFAVASAAFLIVLAVTLYAQFAIDAREDEEQAAHHNFARAHVAQNLQNYLHFR